MTVLYSNTICLFLRVFLVNIEQCNLTAIHNCQLVHGIQSPILLVVCTILHC
jgi:hypothetical protein